MKAVRGFFSGVFCFLLFDVLVFLGLIITLNLTLLNPDFVTTELDKLDVYSVVIEQAKGMLPDQQFIDADTVDKALSELKPWLEQQASTVVHGVWGYLKGAQALNVTVSLEEVRSVVKENLREAVLKSLPPELQGASQSQIDAYMAQMYVEIDKAIPGSFQFSEASVSSQIAAQIQQVKQIIRYIDTAYKWLIGLAVLLVLLIALVHWWQPKPITRSIGVTFILVGVACILGSLLDVLIIQVVSGLAGGLGALSGFQTKLPQLASDLTAPMRMYGIAFLVSGIMVVVISVLFRSQERSPDIRNKVVY
ncbi:MAG: hypothetical protein FJ006_05295 [Chloroflexi bacterium]|nr:hypothetical protein [Chloroflexota bacterium]